MKKNKMIMSNLIFKGLTFLKRFVVSNSDISNTENNLFNIRNVKATLKHMGSGLITTDVNGIISYMNPAAEKITGFTWKESVGLTLFDIYKISHISDSNTWLSNDEVLLDQNIFNCILVTKNGEQAIMSTSVGSIFSSTNKLLGYIIIFQKDENYILSNSYNCSGIALSTHSLGVSDDSSCEYKKSIYDSLTQLPNRRHFYNRLDATIKEASLLNKKLAILFIDLDMFKNINDTLGHDIGDMLLHQTASRLLDALKGKRNNIARMGGDEFCILINDLKDEKQAEDFAQSLLKILALPFFIQDHELFLSASIGLAIYPDHGMQTHDLLKNAGSSMYKAKDQGRNNYQLYRPDMNENTLQRYKMQKSLRHALLNNELVLHYQPKVDGKSGKLVGIEALVRWHHPERGLIYPIEFIPLAEETGLIKQIDQWVLRTACLQLKKWRAEGRESIRLAVNLSAWQFKEQHLADTVAAVLEETGTKPSELELEITETAAMENLNFTVNTLGKLMLMGVNISIDDFGTGYSSLNYLKHFPINFLKIDRTFIADILEDKNTCAIVKAIIEVAHTLSLKVIAEGVETQEQLALLQNLGCDEIQGFYISKPLPVEEIEKQMIYANE